MKFLDIFDTSKTARILLNIFFVINTLVIGLVSLIYAWISFFVFINGGYLGLMPTLFSLYHILSPFIILLLTFIYFFTKNKKQLFFILLLSLPFYVTFIGGIVSRLFNPI